MISGFVAAISFLTRVPIGRRFIFSAEDVGRAAAWFPVVGALLGGVLVLALRLLGHLYPQLVTAVILTGISAVLTGAMHLDGLADTADGFGGGTTPDDVLRIMKDHAIGSYGAVALILAIALRISATAALLDGRHASAALVLAPALGRWTAVLLSATQPYVRPLVQSASPSAGAPARLVGRSQLIIATVVTIAGAAAIDWRRGLIACALVVTGSAIWAWVCRRRIGGITGDTLGAGIEISEGLVLLFFAALP